ncbi:MAG: SpaA isopeptide-forming pilin-related protein [Finegoldia sp.]|nr:SpaA isopeptide-forming pilin-related protein [Finegoldia sp.]
MKKIAKRLICLLSALALVLTCALSTSAKAATGARQTTVNVQKLSYKNGEVQIQNTGEELDLEALGVSAEAYDPTKYGDIEFTVYKLDGAQLPEGSNPQEIANAVEADKTAYGAQVVDTMNYSSDGLFDISLYDGYYVIVETKSPETVVEKAAPMFLALPVTNSTGDGYLQSVYLYPKNKVEDTEFNLTKYAYYNDGESPVVLDGASFNLYKKNDDNTWTQFNTQPLVTANGGKIVVSDLLVGEYKFVETSTGKDNLLLNPNVVDKDTNKLGFYFTAEGKIDYPEGSLLKPDQKVINYEEPTLVKTVSKEIVSTTETYDYTVNVTVPKDIKDYKSFVFTDTSDENIEVKLDTVAVEGYTKDTDYTVSATEGRNFKIDFTVANLNPGAMKVTYSAKLKNAAAANTDLVNTAKIAYSNGEVDGEKESTQKVKTYELQAKKVSGGVFNTGAAKAPLAGAEFNLKNAEGEYLKAELVDGVYVAKEWVASDTEATRFVSGADGMIKVKGLEAGTYSLVEMKAPAGYLLPTTEETYITEITVGPANEAGEVDITEIVNEKNPDLPMTGLERSIVVIGGLLVAMAVAFAFTRLKKEEN